MVAKWCCTMTLGDLTHCGRSRTKSTSTMKYAKVIHQKARKASPFQSCIKENSPVSSPQNGNDPRHCQFSRFSATTGTSATRLNQSCTSRARLESCRSGPSMRKASSTWKWSSMMLLAFRSDRSAYSMPSCMDSSAASFTSSPSSAVNSIKDWRFLGDDTAVASTACDSCSARAMRVRTAWGVSGLASAALLASSAASTARRAASVRSGSSTATMAAKARPAPGLGYGRSGAGPPGEGTSS
mmetsp:Transcript_78432/g.229969  ORF Transcript_78432/g.229969 Transcript_78432/m.229969 type:complete len:241 (+) Transcript_78432:522-1244(+)